jgi:hypothetical protein
MVWSTCPKVGGVNEIAIKIGDEVVLGFDISRSEIP